MTSKSFYNVFKIIFLCYSGLPGNETENRMSPYTSSMALGI